MPRWRTALTIVLLTVAWRAQTAHAQQQDKRQPPPDDMPRLLINGCNSYKSIGAEAAMKSWVEFSALEGTALAAEQIGIMHQAQALFGPFEGCTFITSRIVTPRIRVLYLSLDYERGPLFAKFVLYRSAQHWVLSALDTNPREELLLPLGTTQ